MGTFNTKKQLYGNSSLIPSIASKIESSFVSDGFDVVVQNLYNGGADISISKGNLFKAVIGCKSALKIVLTPCNNGILFDASVGLFGQQIIPSLISWFIAWPVLVAQIWGMVKQSKLDDKALEIAERVVYDGSVNKEQVQSNGSFCSRCGQPIPQGSIYCPTCGHKVE